MKSINAVDSCREDSRKCEEMIEYKRTVEFCSNTTGMESYAVVLVMLLCYFKENHINKNHTTHFQCLIPHNTAC